MECAWVTSGLVHRTTASIAARIFASYIYATCWSTWLNCFFAEILRKIACMRELYMINFCTKMDSVGRVGGRPRVELILKMFQGTIKNKEYEVQRWSKNLLKSLSSYNVRKAHARTLVTSVAYLEVNSDAHSMSAEGVEKNQFYLLRLHSLFISQWAWPLNERFYY